MALPPAWHSSCEEIPQFQVPAMATGSTKVVCAAVIGNLLIAATRFAGALYTGSSAMLSEGVHSLVDTGNEALLLYDMHRARLPADERFPFGHGKEIYFWSFVVALLLFTLGAGVSIYKGIQHMRQYQPACRGWRQPRPGAHGLRQHRPPHQGMLPQGAARLYRIRDDPGTAASPSPALI